MNQNDYTPHRPPTPEQLAAWADGESSPDDADFVEAWLADHPEARREADALACLTRLYREQPIPMPSEDRWRSALDGIRPRVAPAAPRRGRLLLNLALAAAAALGAVVLARTLWPAAAPPLADVTPAPADDDEPFAVAASSEVHIIRMDADDADQVVTGRPLIGTMDFAGPGDIDVLRIQPDPSEKHKPHLETRAGLSWLVARADEEVEP